MIGETVRPPAEFIDVAEKDLTLSLNVMLSQTTDPGLPRALQSLLEGERFPNHDSNSRSRKTR